MNTRDSGNGRQTPAIPVRTTPRLLTGTDEGLVHFVGATHPLKMELVDFLVPEGGTLLDMLRSAAPDPFGLRDAVVFIDDHEVPRELWARVRPKAGHLVTARVMPVPRGGGGGEKNPLRTLLSIAVIAAAFFIGPALGGFLGLPTEAVIAGQTINLAAAVGGALISVAGMLLVNVIAPIRPPQLTGPTSLASQGKETSSLYLSGSANRARPFGEVPSVLGFVRFRPPLGAKTYTEVFGDYNVLRMIVLPGFGELELSGWQIGNTPLEDYDDYELEERSGLSGDAALTLYPGQVDQAEFSVKMTQADGWTSRTSDTNADEISVDFAFPRGLVYFNTEGNRSSRSMTIELEYRKVGSGTWLPVPSDADLTFDASWLSGSAITFTHARAVAVRHGVRWKTGERAQYEVQVRRTTADVDDTQTFDEVYWTALRTFTNEDPILFRIPVAKAALKIRSTDQLNGVVQELSVLAESVCLDWDSGSGTWVSRVTNNPASLFRHVLQGPANADPVPDSDIDLEKLQEWHEFCDTNGFTFNQVRDFSSNVQDTLADLASAGRAGLTNEDGLYSVVIEEPRTTVSSMITPRNSSGFELEKAFIDLPHAWRVPFINEDYWEQDERLVFRDGYDRDTATKYEVLEFPGVTNPEAIWKHGRYYGAMAENVPERWGVTQDFEFLTARRGRRVDLMHDVALIGASSGRVLSLVVDGAGDVTALSVDRPVEMVPGKEYGLVFRRDVSGDVSLSVPVATVAGTSSVVYPLTAIPAAAAPEVGDLYSFGERDFETEDALVLYTTPTPDMAARVLLVPYRAAVYDADKGAIPTHVPTITAEAFLPAPEVESVITDESVLEAGPGDTVFVRAEITCRNVNRGGAYLEAQQQRVGTKEPYYDSDVTTRAVGKVRIGDVLQAEEYNFRVRWNHENLLPSPWTVVPNVKIVGKSTAPEGLVGLTISVFGGQAHLRWNKPSQLDVQFGGEVHFRHSALFSGAEWNGSVSIGDAANARGLFAVLPLKPGTYLARVFDTDGNPSDDIATVTTKQASVLAFASADTLDEAPDFGGEHDGTTAVSGDATLKLDGALGIDSWGDIDDVPMWDYNGGVLSSGTYEFRYGFDFTTVSRVRLTTRLTVSADNVLDSLDDRTELIDTWEDFDGTAAAAADARVFVRHTDDPPLGTPPDYPAAPSPYPAGLTPAVWWDFQDDSNVTKAGGNFTAVADKSATGADLSQGTTLLQPAVGTLNGYQAANFTGAEVLPSAGAEAVFKNAPGSTWVAAVKLDNNTGTRVIASARVGTGADARHNVQHLNDYYSAVFRRLDADAAESMDSAQDSLEAGASMVFVSTLDFVNQVAQLWVNGTKVLEQAIVSGPGSTSNTDSTRVMVGASSTLGQNGWYGQVGEVLGYDFALSDVEVADLTEFLAGKWGIGLTPPTWSAWERLDSAEFEARAFDFKAELTSNDPAYNVLVTELGVDAEELA